MSTNSAIGVVVNGKIKAVYAHWDGYIEGVGKTLLENYDQKLTEELVSVGDISSLGETIGTKHDFDVRCKGMTTFYGRDRGEKNQRARWFNTAEDFVEAYDGEFAYILGTDGVWYVSEGAENDWKKVSEALNEVGVE